MRSFGLWYQTQEDTSADAMGQKENDEVKFSIHVNFWSESIKKFDHTPDLDIGIKIKNFRKIHKMLFHCPFSIYENDIKDLAEKLHVKRNSNMIFNIDGEIETRNLYSVYTFKKEEKEALLIFPLEQDIGKMYEVNCSDNKTDIIFDFSKFHHYLEGKKQFSDINCIYIRFRITTPNLRDSLYFDSEPFNKSFESAFSGTRIIDFKLNEKRNLGEKTLADMETEHWRFANIDIVHLLIMEPASYDIMPFAEEPMTCRELEGNLWNDYYQEELTKEHILAYHWKLEKVFSCLVKVNYSQMKLDTIAAYICVVIALGMFASSIVSILQMHFENDIMGFFKWSFGISGLFFLGGFILGRRNKRG